MTLAQLDADDAARKDPLDLPRTMTQREIDAYVTDSAMLARRRSSARIAAHTLAEVEPQLAEFTAWRDHLTEWRQTLCDQLLDLPPRAPQANGLKLSIIRIDRGTNFEEAQPAWIPLDDLMAAAGYVPRDA